jgi:hypothetical protein
MSRSPARRRRWTLLTLVGIFAGIAGWVWWLVTTDPDVPFLTHRGPAEWIVYPSPPSGFVHPGVDLQAVFFKSFALDRVPLSATLRVRCYRDGVVAINGTPVPFESGPAGNWKRSGDADVSALLHSGTNEIAARVTSRSGPPALWLVVEGEGFVWTTDDSWTVGLAGEDWRPARLATTPMDRWPVPGETADAAHLRPRVLDAARRSLPAWGAFAGLTAAILVGLRMPLPGRRTPPSPPRRAMWLAILAAIVWTLLTWNNLRKETSQLFGFDVEGHLEYIWYVLTRARLPLADEGWQMYQPPLYYVMAAGILWALGATVVDDATLAALGWLNWAGGIVLLASLFGCLRLLFPDCPRRWIAGFALGAFLPARLYLSQYIGNETWAAAWAAASLYACLRILRRTEVSPGTHLFLGVLLGAGMLTKFSALLVLGVTAVVLTGRLLARGERSVTVYARSVGAMLVACAVVCGWHFLRVTMRFGTPLVGNWHPATGFSWWQDPGFHTGQYYTSFGLSLVEPLFSSFHSFTDGVFSTLWGDGLLGGSSQRDVRPPWNYDLMISGYLLACLPSLAILTGAVTALIELVRKPRAEWFLMLGLLGATALALFVMTLRLPFHGQAKAFYGSSAFVPVIALGAWGVDVLGRRSPVVRMLVHLWLGTWALNAAASYWIR